MKPYINVTAFVVSSLFFTSCASIPGTGQNAAVDQLRAIALVAAQQYATTGTLDQNALKGAAINALIAYLSGAGTKPATPLAVEVLAARDAAIAGGLSAAKANATAVAGLQAARK